MAAESSRAFEGGPPEPTFYKETSFSGGIHEIIEDAEDVSLTNQYNKTLDWFAVDLEGEHSAMDGRILEEHTEYVVIAIHAVKMSFFFVQNCYIYSKKFNIILWPLIS